MARIGDVPMRAFSYDPRRRKLSVRREHRPKQGEATMRFKTMATITAALFFAAGLGFVTQEMNLSHLFGQAFLLRPFPQSSADRLRLLLVYGGQRSFIYLFGAALLGCSWLTWAVRNLKDTATQTNISLALFGLNAVLGGFALQQQVSMWKTSAGWIAAGIFFVQAVGYCWLLLKTPKDGTALQTAATEPGTELLREQWAQQIHEAAAQQERNRLARELHDSIKQQLFSINVNAATVQTRWQEDERGAKDALARVRNSVREAMAEMEALLHNLRPAPLETIGLIEALRQQCEALQYRTGAQVITELGELPADNELPVGAQDALFRITQEALANIARHARAQTVRVQLHRQTHGDEDVLWLKIADDGGGFASTEAYTGMGLANIRARVFEIGGALQVDSRAGEGTSLTVSVPLLANEQRNLRRELRLAFVFTLVGFLISGSWLLSHSGPYWPAAGLPLFALSAWRAYRVAQSLRRMKTAGSLAAKQTLELQGQLRQLAALWIGALFWSLENWHLAAELWHVYLPNETAYLILWPLLTAAAAFRVQQTLRAQTRLLTRQEFVRVLTHWRQWALLFLAAALTFLFARPGILAYPILRQILIWRGYGPQLAQPSFQPLRAFWVATLVLLLYCLFLLAWQWWVNRPAPKTPLVKGTYDPSRIGG